MVSKTLIAAIAAAQRRQAEEAARANDPAAFRRNFAALREHAARAQSAPAATVAPQGFEEEADDAPARLPDIPTVHAAPAASRRTKGRAR